MIAKIYQPARNAMQSGQGKSRIWILEYVPAETRVVDPLMGWTGSGDMNSQLQLKFDSQEAAISYADRNGITYELYEPRPRKHILRRNGYGDNFATDRRSPWTH